MSMFISGSATSTGSFGRVELTGDIVIPNNNYLYFEGDSDDAFNRIGKSSGENAVLMTSRFKAGVLIDSNNDDTDSFFRVGHNGTTLAAATSLLDVTADGKISGSATSTGSFGNLRVMSGSAESFRVNSTSIRARTDEFKINTTTNTTYGIILDPADNHNKITLNGSGVQTINMSKYGQFETTTTQNTATQNFLFTGSFDPVGGMATPAQFVRLSAQVSSSTTNATSSFTILDLGGTIDMTGQTQETIRGIHIRPTKTGITKYIAIEADGDISGSADSTGSFGKVVIPMQGNNVAFEALDGNFSVANTIFEHSANAGNLKFGSQTAGMFHTGGKVRVRVDSGFSAGDEAFKAQDWPVAAGFWVDSSGNMQLGTGTSNGATVQMASLSTTGDFETSGSLIATTGNISGSATSTGSFGHIRAVGNITGSGLRISQGKLTLAGTTSGFGAGDIGMTGGYLVILGGSNGVNINGHSGGLDKNQFQFTAAKISGSSISTGSFGHLLVDGQKVVAPAVTSYTNASDNRILTSVDSETINGEANLTFDGSQLDVGSSAHATVHITGASGKDANVKLQNNSRLWIFQNDGDNTLAKGAGTLHLYDGTAGSTRIAVDSTGVVEMPAGVSGSSTSTGSFGALGLGVASPYYKGHIKFDDSTTSFSGGGSGNWGGNGLRIENNNGTADTKATLQLRSGDFDALISAVKKSGADQGEVQFNLDPGADSNQLLALVGSKISGSSTSTGSFGRLEVGASRFSGDIITERVLQGNGTEALPSHTFENDSDTGMFRVEANGLGFSTNGTKAININSSQTVTFSGDLQIPAEITHVGDANTLIRFDTDQIKLQAGGVDTIFTTTQISGSATSTGSFGYIKTPGSVEFGDLGGDNYSSLRHLTADDFGFDFQHDNATAIVNEQGTTNQVLVLGDVNNDQSNPLFGIANNQSGTGWTKKFVIQGDGNALFYGTKISGSATSTGSFGYAHIADKVGIGTGSPDHNLHVSSSGTVDIVAESQNFGIKLSADNNNSRAIILLDRDSTDGVGAGGDYAYIRYDSAGLDVGTGENLPIVFEPNGAERVRITTAGIILNSSAAHVSASATSTGSFGNLNIASSGQSSILKRTNMVHNLGSTINLLDLHGSFQDSPQGLTGIGLGFHMTAEDNGNTAEMGRIDVHSMSGALGSGGSGFGVDMKFFIRSGGTFTEMMKFRGEDGANQVVFDNATKISGSATSTGSFGTLNLGSTSPNIDFFAPANDPAAIRFTEGGTSLTELTYDGSHLRLKSNYANRDIFLDTPNGDLMIDSTNGNVGINTSSPSTTRRLHIYNTDDTRGIYIENTSATSYAELHLKANREFRVGTGGASSAADAQNNFYVYDATAAAHRFTIDSSGNVGIGDTSPSNKLEINDANSNSTWESVKITNSNSVGAGLTLAGGVKNWSIISNGSGGGAGSGNLGFHNTTDGGYKFIIDSDAATELLTLDGSIISGSATSTGSFGHGIIAGNLDVGGTLTAQEIHTEFTSASIQFQSGSTKFGDTHDDKHQITGSVDISGSLVLKGSDGSTATFDGAGNQVTLNLRPDSSNNNYIVSTNNEFSFRPGGTTVMNIESSGEVGIGTQNPSQTLEVAGAALINNGTSNHHLYLGNTSYGIHVVHSTGVMNFVSNGSTRLSIGNGAHVNVTSDFLPTSDNTSNLGSSSKRWANVHSADLHLSNEDTKGNEVDGTTGNWTIQEGEDDLYLLNRKNGKKYKFKLEEIK